MSKRRYDQLNFVEQEDETPSLDPIFGQKAAFEVPKLHQSRIHELSTDPGGVTNVEEYLSLVRHQAETSASFESVYKEHKKPIVRPIESQPPKTHDEAREEWGKAAIELYHCTSQRYKTYEQHHQRLSTAELPSTIAKWKLLISTTPPNLTILYQLDLHGKLKLISLIQRWSSKAISLYFIQWVFATVMVLPQLLSYSDVAVLRAWGKKLSKLLPVVEDQGTKVCYEWCLLIIARIYGQKDLI